MDEATSLGGALYRRRVYERRMSARQAAAEIGCSTSTLLRWERGGPVLDPHVVGVADFLGVAPEEVDKLRAVEPVETNTKKTRRERGT